MPIPIDRTMLNTLYDAKLRSDVAAEACLVERAEPVAQVRTSEDVVVSAVGAELYRTFWGYTRKQWELAPRKADAA